MGRRILEEASIHPDIRALVAGHHAEVVEEVRAAIAAQDIVVVGMAQNPWPRMARRILREQGAAHTYLEYGSYLQGWRRRTALKMWAGWPTFPMIFLKGRLIGGASDLRRLVRSGEFQRLLAAKSGGE